MHDVLRYSRDQKSYSIYLHPSGVTVGFVVIPQGMAYALLAKLPPEYGLYTSFVGFLLYWAFATSKDITIGVRTPKNELFHTQL